MGKSAEKLVHGEITNKIIRAFYDVYDELTPGIPESAFHKAMQIALRDLGVKFETEVDLSVYFRGELVGKYRADLIVEGKVIVEIKTAPRIVEAHINQLFGYLKISQLQVGLLLNFGPEPKFERYFLNSRTKLSE
ncbi:MAG: GxxExxY protein [Gemmatimonadaceae bacterium]